MRTTAFPAGAQTAGSTVSTEGRASPASLSSHQARILKALALRQLPNHELRAAAGFLWNDESLEGKLSDLRDRGLIVRWQTKKGAPRCSSYGPGWELTHEGRKWIAAYVLAAAPAVPFGGQKPDSHQPVKEAESAKSRAENSAPQGETSAETVALQVLKALAAHPDGMTDRDLRQATWASVNEREKAYAPLRVRGFIRPRPDSVMVRMFEITPAGRAHLVALEPPPCRALIVRPCLALMIVPSSAVSLIVL